MIWENRIFITTGTGLILIIIHRKIPWYGLLTHIRENSLKVLEVMMPEYLLHIIVIIKIAIKIR